MILFLVPFGFSFSFWIMLTEKENNYFSATPLARNWSWKERIQAWKPIELFLYFFSFFCLVSWQNPHADTHTRASKCVCGCLPQSCGRREEELYSACIPRTLFFLSIQLLNEILGRDIVVYAKLRLVAPSIQLRLPPHNSVLLSLYT